MSIIPQIILNSIIAGAIYAMIALGFTLIYRTAKFFDIGYGALIAVGGYVTFLLGVQLDLPMWLAIVIGTVGSGIVGVLINIVVYQPLRKRQASNMVMLVASLGVFIMLQALLAIIFTSQFQTLGVAGEQKVFEVAGAFITSTQVIILIIGIVVMTGLSLVIKYTMFGKKVKAIGDDIEVSKIVGINTTRVMNGVFFIGSAIAGLGGILVGFDTGIEPTMGMALLLKGVVAAIIGGIGSFPGAVLGAFLLGLVENIGVWQLSGEWKDAIAFVLLIIFLLVRPRGILGKK